MNNWESLKLVGLYNNPGRGRHKLFTLEQEKIIKEWVKETPKNLEKVQEKIKKNWNITSSKETIKRTIKSLKMGWYRTKRRVAGSPDDDF
ncbi:transposase (fragment) [Hyella patelloides LEGE 07179]|uniref:Transposase n=1 Tax=Hyella patelloides LEGE 07179 TaxID=945734 RepID=A0A563VPP9_9CYAN